MKKPQAEEPSAADEVPAYIVTFSDMVTLLLTFFVMLLSLADVQDPELFNKGRDSFVQALEYCGLGIFSGREIQPGNPYVKTLYQTQQDDPNAYRTIDEEREYLEQILDNVGQFMTAMPSQIASQTTQFTTIHIPFTSGGAELNETGQQEIQRFAMELRGSLAQSSVTLYVLGLGDASGGPRDQWMLSARRAQVVATYLKQQLPSGPNMHIYNWGAGLGSAWAGRDGVAQENAKILIAVLRQ